MNENQDYRKCGHIYCEKPIDITKPTTYLGISNFGKPEFYCNWMCLKHHRSFE